MSVLSKLHDGFVSWFDKANNGNFLFATAAIGWFLASAAQTFGIAHSKELTKEEKKFLIPQEMADGAVNIGMYALVTTNLMKFSENLLKPGKKAKPFITLKDEAGNILDYAKNTKDYIKMGNNFRAGAAILGGVISTCILTPIIRNAVGAYIKKKGNEISAPKENASLPQKPYPARTQPYFTNSGLYQAKPFNSFSGNLKI